MCNKAITNQWPEEQHVFANKELDGGFEYVLFSSLPGGMIQFDEHIFEMDWFNHLEKTGFFELLGD